MAPVILNGGDLGGREVQDWPLHTVREFRQGGKSHFYRNDTGVHATFVGHESPFGEPVEMIVPEITPDETVVEIGNGK